MNRLRAITIIYCIAILSIGSSVYSQEKKVLVPSADFSYTGGPCVGDIIKFTNNSSDYTSVYWDFGNDKQTYVENPIHIFAQAGTFTITLTATKSGTSETNQTQQTIDISALPDAELLYSGDTSFLSGQSVDITAVGTFDFSEWFFEGETTNQVTESLNVMAEGYYTAKLSTTEGCLLELTSSFIEVNTIIEPTDSISIVIVNGVMTPNGDGLNDVLLIKDFDNIIDPIILTVYNRWGKIIHYDENYDNLWNATRDGKELPSGTYYYYVQGGGKKGTAGFIDILR